ncbi:MAG: pyridoxal phosphate-dependent aminotransferase [Acidobacteria bacterium]|nr:pyridoxal phosphate-dependent aminotransferase [Acidobacteriota bacterium]
MTGLTCPRGLLGALADPRGVVYRPDPLGHVEAREAVAASYARQGANVSPADLVLTASTSEAYAFLFKLLCDPGDRVLVPRPSYPLFELLAGLEGIELAPYRLDPLAGWRIDRADLERALTPRVRAVLVVSPNNPTGSMIQDDERDWLTRLAADRDMAIVADEVFGDYRLSPRRTAASFAGHASRALTFTLGGLSKSAALPQLKLAWMAMSGPADLKDAARERLELVADTYLSVATPVQIAAAALVESGVEMRRRITERLIRNLGTLRAAVARHPSVTLLEPEGGWSALLRVPATSSEETLVLRAVEEAQVLVHPGYFFDFPGEAYLVVSLLPEPARFEAAVARLLPVVAGHGAR